MKIPTKHCKSGQNCLHPDGPDLPATPEFFPRNHRMKDGLINYCKLCEKARRQPYVEAHREQARKYSREWYATHIERALVSRKAWREKNAEHIREQRRVYKRDHLETVRAGKRRYVQNHPDRLRERMRLYHAANLDKHRANEQRRRARIKGNGGSFTPEDIARQLKAQKGKCYWCHLSIKGDYHIDHVIPISRGGTNDPSNIVISCPHCNWSRNDQLPHEWSGSDKLL